MRNQFLKTMMMIAVLFVLSAVSGRAQAGSNFMVTLPFDFIVSGKTLPAGEYVVARSTSGSEGLVIRPSDRKGGIYLLTTSIHRDDRRRDARVVFRRYGNLYFLSQVWMSGKETGRELFKSHKQRALERDLAQRAGKSESITVAARKE